MDKHVFVETENKEETGVILNKVSDGKKIEYEIQLDNGETVTVDTSKVKNYKIEDNYITDLNGRKEDFSETPIVRRAITYYNHSASKWQTQNYIDLDNIIVSPMVRINEKTGEFEFALSHRSNASMLKNQQYNGKVWEVPEFSVRKNYSLSEEEIFDKQCHYKYGEEYFGSRKLEDKQTPVSQSFTNQLASFKILLVYYNENSNLNWFPISSLLDCINKNLERPFTSLQTSYALELLYDTYKEQIDKGKKTPFNIQVVESERSIKTKEVSPNKYRFGIEDIILEEDGKKEYDTYATSKNSVQCILTRKINDGQVQIGLSKQQRSPFIAEENFDEYLYEITAGMVEAGENYRHAAVRETKEETGYELKQEKLRHIGGPLIISLATQELSDFYLYEMDNNQQKGDQDLDAQENIEQMEWINLDDLDLEQLHSPLPTKYAILKTMQYYKELERKHNEIVEIQK